MALFTVNIANTVSAYGGGPTTKWDVGVWDDTSFPSGVWDEQDNLTGFYVHKCITQAVTLSDNLGKHFIKAPITLVVSVNDDITDRTRYDSNGYEYVLPGGGTNAEDQVFSTYTAQTWSTSIYSSITYTTSTWSSVT